MVIGHVAPEAVVGGAIALIQEGDSITIDYSLSEMSIRVHREMLRVACFHVRAACRGEGVQETQGDFNHK